MVANDISGIFFRTHLGSILLMLCLALFFATPAQLIAQVCSPSAAEIPLNGIDEDCDGLDDIFLHMPPHVYTVVGQEFELYFRNTILSTHPNDYRFTVTTSVGGGTTNLEKWVYTPTIGQVGQHNITLEVRSQGGQLLKSASSVLRVSPAGTPPNMSAKKMMLWGHSFIDQGYMPYYLDSLILTGNNPAVTYHGKRANWIDNFKTRFEAVGGSSWLQYYATPSSPFFYFGQLNMRSYFDEVCGFGQNPDWLVIHLDVNDYLFNGSLDAATLQSVDTYVNQIYAQRTQPMIAAIKAAAPNVKIAISYTPMPNARQSAFTNTFGSASILANRYRWQKIVSRLMFLNTQFFANRENENIYLLPIHLDLDDLNDYGTTDPVHPVVDVSSLPAKSGYREIARSTYAWLKYIQNPSGTPPPCIISSATATTIRCDNAGTINNPSDDTFTFNLTVNGQNGTGTWRTNIAGQTITGSYGVAKAVGPFLISSGTLNFTVTDNTLTACGTNVSVIPPATCSNGVPQPTICTGNLLQNTDFEVGTTANWNGTASIVQEAASGVNAVRVCGTSYTQLRQTIVGEALKTYTLVFDAKRDASGGTTHPYAHIKFLTTGFNLIDVRTAPVNSATYQEYVFNTNSPSGTAYIEVALVVDAGTGCITADDICFTQSTITPTCSISGQVTNVQCDNNGTPTITTDDRYTYNLTVTGTNASAGWNTTFNGQNTTGTYGTARAMGPANISSGAATLTIRDNTTTTCTTTVQVTPPAPCSSVTPPTGGCSGNMLANPGFENNLDSWNHDGVTIVTDAAAGTKAVRVCGTGFTSIRQTVAATAGANLELKAIAKRESTTATRYPVLQIKAMSSGWQPLLIRTVDITANAYTNKTVTITTPAGTAWVEAMLFIDNGAGCAVVDEFCLAPASITGGGDPTNYCPAAGVSPWEDWVSSVSINNTPRVSGKAGYTDFTATTFNVSRISTNNLELKATYSYFTHEPYWKAWIDFNRNGTFEEPAEIVLQARSPRPTPAPDAVSTATGNFNVPAGAGLGNTRMRVTMSRTAYVGPCDNPQFGEVEDYTINLGTTVQSTLPDGATYAPQAVPEAYTVYPNPAAQAVWVALGTAALDQNTSIQVFDLTGKPVLAYQSDRLPYQEVLLDVAHFNSGVYFIQITVGNTRPIMRKLVVANE